MSAARILVACHDAGGGSALAPVVARLRNRAAVEVWAHPLSAPALEPADRIAPELEPDAAEAAISAFRPDLLLTGSSWGDTTIDKRMTAAARSAGVASLGILDSWTHCRERFTAKADGVGPLVHLPDRLGIMDTHAFEEMTVLEFPTERLTVTGLTRLAELPEPGGEASERRRLAEAYGLDPDAAWIYFISQAISALTGGHAGARTSLGYSERDALDGLAAALPAITVRLGRPAVLVLRFHPREEVRNAASSAVVDRENTALAFIRAADVVVGISGGNLLDAYALGRPTVSFQPQALGRDDCILSSRAIIARVTHSDALPDHIAACLEGRVAPSPTFSRAGGIAAAESTARLALTMAAEGRSHAAP